MPYTRPYSGGFVDYPNTGTPINASALNTMDLGIKAANDQIQTVTTAQRTTLASTATVGQTVWDSDLKEFFVFINATGGNAWQGFGNQIICTSTTRPLTPFAGQKIYETDTKRSYVYEAGAWRLDTFNRYVRNKYTAGNITLNSTTWANVQTATDVTLNAVSGDVIEYGISGLAVTAAVILGFDVVSVVAGSPVNSFGLDAAAPSTYASFVGVSGWYVPPSVDAPISGSIFRTLAAGDISSGTVTMRLRYCSATATARTLNATAVSPLEIWARNLGQVTT